MCFKKRKKRALANIVKQENNKHNEEVLIATDESDSDNEEANVIKEKSNIDIVKAPLAQQESDIDSDNSEEAHIVHHVCDIDTDSENTSDHTANGIDSDKDSAKLPSKGLSCSDYDVKSDGSGREKIEQRQPPSQTRAAEENSGDGFTGHREQMRQMNQMFRDPFGLSSPGMLSLAAPPQMRRQQHHPQNHQQLAPVDLFNFGGFNNMFRGFQDMRRMLTDMHSTLDSAGASNSPSSRVFTQSSFVSFSNSPGGQPKVYQASSSTTQGPGGVRETRKMMRDSESGVEKVAVGHHLGNRAHVVERQRNRRTGDEEQNQEFINLDEEEAPEFDREWQEQRRQVFGHERVDYRRRQDRANRRHQALPAPGQRPSHNRNPSYRDRE